MPLEPVVRRFDAAHFGGVQYLVFCPRTRRAAVIDPVFERDASGAFLTTSADLILAEAAKEGLTIDWILDTHAHTDSAASYLKRRTGARMGTVAELANIEALWADLYDPGAVSRTASDWDVFFDNGDLIRAGDILGRVKFAAKHQSLSYVFGEIVSGGQPAVQEGDGGAIKGRHDAASPIVRGFHEPRTGSVQYLVVCPTTKRAAIIDPVLDFDEASGSIATTSADAILAHVESMGATVEWVLDTHPHADHLSAAYYLQGKTGARTGTGVRVLGVQELWRDVYGLPESACGRSHWDVLFEDGDEIRVGAIEGTILFSPGHTMASITFVLGDAAFIHDTLFMPEAGTARADFPGGDATRLYESITAILAMPDHTRLYTGHDYPPAGGEAHWESTVAVQRATNIHWRDAPTSEEFVAMRRKRDATLPLPRLILPSLQVNIRGGRLPEPDADGRRYLKLPLDAFRTAVWS